MNGIEKDMNTKINILMLTPDYTPVYSGVGTHVVNLCKNLYKSKQCNIYVVVIRMATIEEAKIKNSTKRLKKIVKEGITIFEVFIGDFTKRYYKRFGKQANIRELDYILPDGMLLEEIVECLRKEKLHIDIIHNHSFHNSVFCKLLAQYLDCPLIFTIHTNHNNKKHQKSLKKYLWEHSIKSSNCCILLSNIMKEEIGNILGDIPCEVIYNSIDIDAQNSYIEGDYERRNDLLYCGRLSRGKNVLQLFEAIKELITIEEFKDIKLYVAGEGGQRGNLEKYIKENQLSKNIIMLGRITQKELNEYYRQVRLTIIPSKREVFNTVALEASSKGCSLLLSPLDSFKEMFGENRIIFFDKFNAQSIYEKIKKYYFDIETLDYFAKKAFRHVKKCYAWEKNCMKIMSLYQRVISEYQREVDIESREQKVIVWLDD